MITRLIPLRRPTLKPRLRCSSFASAHNTPLASESQNLNFHSSIVNSQTLNPPIPPTKNPNFASITLRQLLTHISHVCPATVRKFRRAAVLKPEQALELLTDFQHGYDSLPIEAEKVKSLLEIFNRVKRHEMGFVCLSDASRVMASLLLRAGLFIEVENFICSTPVLLDSTEILSNLIEGYVGSGELQRAVLVYQQVRARGKHPSISCYCELLGHLIHNRDVQMTLQVCKDALELGVKLNNAKYSTFNDIIRFLCRYGKIQDARNVAKKGMSLGFEPSVAVLDEIVSEYCEQANFEDALGLFQEIRRTPSAKASHKILHSFCAKLGTKESEEVLLELKHLGFIPDEVTYGILIGWICHYGELKYAFFYLSEMFSRGLVPDVRSYDALIAALFKEGMCKQAHSVFLEMIDRGLKINLSTFEVLLAGYCKARQFEEVKAIIREMVDRGLIKLEFSEDPLLKAFELLHFTPSAIRVVRDNNAGLSLAEFYDNLGNGLYLKTDEHEYEFRLDEVHEHSITLDFDALAMREISDGNLRKSLALANKAFRWGQEVSSSTLTCLIREVHESVSHVKSISHLLEQMPKLYNQLDHKTLNCLLQAFSKKGFTYQAASIVEVMLLRHLTISDVSYSSYIMCLCEKGYVEGLLSCWLTARSGRWLPLIKDVEPLVGYLLKHNMLNEALELHKSLIVANVQMSSDINHIFIKKLCELGYPGAAHILFQRIQDGGHIEDNDAYNYLIEGFLKEKCISEALTMFEKMLASNMLPSLTVSMLLIPHLCKSRLLDKLNSLETLCFKRHPSELLVIYKTLIKGFSDAGKIDKVAEKLHYMVMDGVIPDSETFNLLIRDCCQEGQLAKALELFGAMIRHDARLEIPSYGKFVFLLCKTGNVLRSLNLRVFMLLESDCLILPFTNILLFYLFKTSNSSYVEQILGELSERKVLADAVTYDYLVQGYFHCGNAFKSLTNLLMMMSKELNPSPRSLRMAVTLLCEEGMLDKAFSVIKEMELRGLILSSTVQYKLADSLLCQNRIHDAENFLDQMAQKGMIGVNIDYNNLVKKFCSCERLNKAVDLVDIMLRKGNIPNMMAYESLIHSFCLLGKLDQALDFHAEMMDFNIRPSSSTWDVLIQNSCKFGKGVQAEELLNALVQTGEVPTHNMYCFVVEKYQSEKNLVKASSILQAMHEYGYNAEFGIQWSLISNLTNSDLKTGGKTDNRFLSKLLSESGFSHSKKYNSSTR